MIFFVTGTHNGQPVQLGYAHGVLTGPPDMVTLLQMLANSKAGEPVGPVGQRTMIDHLDSPLSAKLLMAQLIDGAEFSGDIPQVGQTPKGATI